VDRGFPRAEAFLWRRSYINGEMILRIIREQAPGLLVNDRSGGDCFYATIIVN